MMATILIRHNVVYSLHQSELQYLRCSRFVAKMCMSSTCGNDVCRHSCTRMSERFDRERKWTFNEEKIGHAEIFCISFRVAILFDI